MDRYRQSPLLAFRSRKTTVEEAVALPSNVFSRALRDRRTTESQAIVEWSSPDHFSCLATVSSGPTPIVRLRYESQALENSLEQTISFQPARLWFGIRWFFRCPLCDRENAAPRLASKLYLPPSELFFGCRTCHDLTYESVRHHDKRIDRIRRDPGYAEEILRSGRATARQVMQILQVLVPTPRTGGSEVAAIRWLS